MIKLTKIRRAKIIKELKYYSKYDDIYTAKIILVSSLASVITVPIVALLIN